MKCRRMDRALFEGPIGPAAIEGRPMDNRVDCDVRRGGRRRISTLSSDRAAGTRPYRIELDVRMRGSEVSKTPVCREGGRRAAIADKTHSG